MTTLRSFVAPLVSAAAALTLSLTLIANTVATPADPAHATVETAA